MVEQLCVANQIALKGGQGAIPYRQPQQTIDNHIAITVKMMHCIQLQACVEECNQVRRLLYRHVIYHIPTCVIIIPLCITITLSSYMQHLLIISQLIQFAYLQLLSYVASHLTCYIATHLVYTHRYTSCDYNQLSHFPIWSSMHDYVRTAS